MVNASDVSVMTTQPWSPGTLRPIPGDSPHCASSGARSSVTVRRASIVRGIFAQTTDGTRARLRKKGTTPDACGRGRRVAKGSPGGCVRNGVRLAPEAAVKPQGDTRGQYRDGTHPAEPASVNASGTPCPGVRLPSWTHPPCCYGTGQSMLGVVPVHPSHGDTNAG